MIIANLQNGATRQGVVAPQQGPVITIENIGNITLNGTIESVAGSGSHNRVPVPENQPGQINITNSFGDLDINSAAALQGSLVGNNTNLSSSVGSVNVFVSSVTALTIPFPTSLVPTTSVSGSAATGFKLTVLNDNLTLGGPLVSMPAVQSTTGNINVSLLSSGIIQVNSNIQAMAGNVTISNPVGALNATASNANITGNNVILTAQSNIRATGSGSFNATNSLTVDTTESSSIISLAGTFSSGSNGSPGTVTISVGAVPGTPTLGTTPPGVIIPDGPSQIFWNNSVNTVNWFGSGAIVNAKAPGQIIINPGSGGQITVGPGSTLKAISYNAPLAMSGLELSTTEIDQIGCLFFEGTLYRGSDAEHLVLPEGSVFLRPRRQTEIDCGDNVIHVPGNSCVLVERDANGLRLYCLSDHHRNESVTLQNKYDGAISALNGGQRLVVGHNKSSLAELREDSIGERCIRSNTDGCQTICEFSIPVLLRDHVLLRELKSTASHLAQATHSEILKTAAALSIVQASHGAYRIYHRGPATQI